LSPALRNVLILSGLLKVVLAVTFADLEPRYDETEYLRFGQEVQAGASPDLWRAPGYQWFVAAGLTVAGGRPVGVRLLQVLLSMAATFLVYRIGRERWGERAGLAAATFVAFYPSQVAFSHYLWSEVLYGFLVLFAFERTLAADRRGSLAAAVGAGALFGTASLTRSLGLALLAVSLLWLVHGRWRERGPKRSLSLAGAVLGVAALVVVPWSIRASALAGRTVIVDVNAAFNLWSGNNEYIPPEAQGIWSVGLPLGNGSNPGFDRQSVDAVWRGEVRQRMAADGVREPLGPDGAEWYRTEASRHVREDPLGVLQRAPKKLAALWAPDFFLPRHLVRDWYGPTPPTLAAFLVALTWIAAAIPLLAGPGALAALRPGRFRSLACAWIIVYLVVHALAYGHSRMHQPLVPLLVLAVAGLLFDDTDAPRHRRVAGRAAPWVGLAVASWIWVWPVLGGLYLMPGPSHVGVARLVAVGRHLPLPGAERLTWMLAAAEASRGEGDRALRVVEGSRHAEESWSLYLRAMLQKDGRKAADLVERALRVDPDLRPAQRLARELAPPEMHR
jgi:4-amino-4-deoxy-L-arabinose transferase-like glycosyltransferase